MHTGTEEAGTEIRRGTAYCVDLKVKRCAPYISWLQLVGLVPSKKIDLLQFDCANTMQYDISFTPMF